MASSRLGQSRYGAGAAPYRARVYQTPLEWEIGRALRAATFWLIVFSGSIFGLGLQIVNSQLVAHLEGLGVAATLAASALGTMALVSAVSRLVGGPIGDRVEPRILLGLGLVGELVGALLLIGASSPGSIYAAVVVFGMGYGFAYVAVPSLIANYFGRQAYTQLYGIRLPVSTVIGAIGPYAAGAIFDATGTYRLVFIAYAVIAGVAAVVAFSARPTEPFPALAVEGAM